MGDTDPRIGATLHDRYVILDRLGSGSMATVYRGERVKLGRPVAIKFLHESFAIDDDGRRRFEVEARAMSRLNHPNCVTVTDFGVDQGRPYLVLDYVVGHSLRDMMAQHPGPFEVARSLRLTRQTLAGLAHAHSHGIIHRDVKPENVLVAEVAGHGEQALIADFGLAKLRDDVTVTTGLALGTPSYMSPEQTLGQSVDARTDVYSVGIMLFELLVGRKPFQAESPFEIMRMHREDRVPALSKNAPEGIKYSKQLDAVVQTALAKGREDRFASCQAFLDALAQVPESGATGARSGSWWQFWR